MSVAPGAAPLVLVPGEVGLSALARIHAGDVRVAIDPRARAAMDRSRAIVAGIVSRDDVVYGINTGFGRLATTRIAHDRLAELQRNLVRSHAVGTGDPLAPPVVRLVLATKALSLARGHSGVRPELVDALIALLNADLLPRVPCQGSVGASGDLAPLAHLACVLIGEGEVAAADGEVLDGAEALRRVGLAPFVLGPKEGLALLNGTQVSTALALAALFDAERVFAAALLSGALSLEAIQGSIRPFDARVHAARGQPGQIAVAAAVRGLLEGSEIVPSHADCGRVQDPYSVRCIPQVMGACLDNLTRAARTLEIEANAASDNPLVFDDDVISGGNFHAEPVAFAADAIALAVAETGAIAERRIALLLDTGLSGLPAFLVRDSGLNSGFMIAQVTAAALASENKSLAHPASVDSLPTSANQEDHVSMATFAARRLHAMVRNTAVVVGIEAMAAAQGIELKRAPAGALRSSAALEREIVAIRARVAFLERDRFLANDIEAMRVWAMTASVPDAIASILPSHRRTDETRETAP
ncbi:MAG: histidine ammonia-lyase [Lautropia sp.]